MSNVHVDCNAVSKVTKLEMLRWMSDVDSIGFFGLNRGKSYHYLNIKISVHLEIMKEGQTYLPLIIIIVLFL